MNGHGIYLDDITIRHAGPSDHRQILSVIPDWWGGRDLRNSIPKLLLIHFSPTSFAAFRGRELCGFLIGFFSQTYPDEGYIHFIGVHPDCRHLGLAKRLYEKFYSACLKDGRHIVRACTDPVNKTSVCFHRQMGFSVEQGPAESDGLPVTIGYLHDSDRKVLFKKILTPGHPAEKRR